MRNSRNYPGVNHLWDRSEELPVEVERFISTLHREEVELDRYLATVLFTDIVESTPDASAGGDARGARCGGPPPHRAGVARAVSRHRVDTAGDGFFATFDGPARAIRCAEAIVRPCASSASRSAPACTPARCETIDGKAGGIAVSIGARVAAHAGASEVLVSQTVKDLTAGSGLVFDDAGEHELKGVPDRWHLYRVVGP